MYTGAGGKPSTWLPPGRLVERKVFKRQFAFDFVAFAQELALHVLVPRLGRVEASPKFAPDGQHEDGDYILGDDEEIKIIESIIEEEIRLYLEKKKREFINLN